MATTRARGAASAPAHPAAAARVLRPSDSVAWRNAAYTPPAGMVRMQCQHPSCRACGLIVAVEREALDFAAADRVHVLCHDCRQPLFLVDRPLGGAR